MSVREKEERERKKWSDWNSCGFLLILMYWAGSCREPTHVLVQQYQQQAQKNSSMYTFSKAILKNHIIMVRFPFSTYNADANFCCTQLLFDPETLFTHDTCSLSSVGIKQTLLMLLVSTYRTSSIITSNEKRYYIECIAYSICYAPGFILILLAV